MHAPLLTLVSPAAGSSVAQNGATFSGVAGAVYGDASTVLVSLWHGTSAKGKPIGTAHATIKGTTWSVTWPHKLALGLYTAQATQTDDAGHTTRTSAHTFLAVPSSTTIGDGVTLTRGGTAYIPVLCMAPAGSFCNGTVLVVDVQVLPAEPRWADRAAPGAVRVSDQDPRWRDGDRSPPGVRRRQAAAGAQGPSLPCT